MTSHCDLCRGCQLHSGSSLTRCCSPLSPSAHSECRVWPGSVAEVLPSGLSSVPQSQLCGSPWRGDGGSDAGCGGAAQLWAEASGAVPVLDLLLCLHLFCALCCLLEHLCLQLARCASAPAAMTSSLAADKILYYSWVRKACWVISDLMFNTSVWEHPAAGVSIIPFWPHLLPSPYITPCLDVCLKLSRDSLCLFLLNPMVPSDGDISLMKMVASGVGWQPEDFLIDCNLPAHPW